MGTIVQRSLSDGTLRYRAEIRINRKDFPTYKESKTFNTKRIAEKWVKKREVEIENNPDILNGNQHEKSIKLSDAIDLYLNETEGVYSKTKVNALKLIKKFPIAKKSIMKLNSMDLSNHVALRKTYCPKVQVGPVVPSTDITKNNIRYQPDAIERPNDWEVGQQQQSQGVEFSFIGQVLDNLYVRGGYGYTDATWKSDSRTTVKEEERLNGKKLSGISENTGNLFVRYLPVEKWYGELGATYVGSYFTSDKNTTKMPDWTRLDAAVGYKDDKWGATIAVNNLTNKEYWRSNSMPGTPRNYLLRMNYYF